MEAKTKKIRYFPFLLQKTIIYLGITPGLVTYFPCTNYIALHMQCLDHVDQHYNAKVTSMLCADYLCPPAWVKSFQWNAFRSIIILSKIGTYRYKCYVFPSLHCRHQFRIICSRRNLLIPKWSNRLASIDYYTETKNKKITDKWKPRNILCMVCIFLFHRCFCLSFLFCFLIFGRLIRRANHKECNANVHPSSWSQSHFCRRPSVIFHAGVNEFPRAIAQFSANIPMLRVIMAKRRKWKVTYWLVHKLKLSMNEWTQIKAALRVTRYARNNRKLRKKFVFFWKFCKQSEYEQICTKSKRWFVPKFKDFKKKLTYFTFYRERSIWI